MSRQLIAAVLGLALLLAFVVRVEYHAGGGLGWAAPGPAGSRRSPRPDAGSGGPGRRASLGVTATRRARSGTPE